jgi:group I intron endonuclease
MSQHQRDKQAYMNATPMQREVVRRAGGVYMIRMANGRYYGGRTKDFDQRFAQHLRSLKAGTHINPRMQASFDKHGVCDFTVVCEITEESAQEEAEQEWLDKHFGQPLCMNLNPSAGAAYALTPAGRGVPYTDQHRRRISEALTGRPHGPMSEEGRKARSDAQKGVPKSEEHKKKIAASLKGHVPSQDTRDKIREALTGRKMPEDQRARLSAAMKGRKLSAAHREKLRQAALRREERKRQARMEAVNG